MVLSGFSQLTANFTLQAWHNQAIETVFGAFDQERLKGMVGGNPSLHHRDHLLQVGFDFNFK